MQSYAKKRKSNFEIVGLVDVHRIRTKISIRTKINRCRQKRCSHEASKASQEGKGSTVRPRRMQLPGVRFPFIVSVFSWSSFASGARRRLIVLVASRMSLVS